MLQTFCKISRSGGDPLDSLESVTVRPRLNEVASRLGISEATVSRVLNGKQGVAHQTREKVLHVLGELGYQDIPIRPVSSGVVGIVTPELDNPIFPALAQAIEARLVRAGLLPMICSATADTINEQEYLDHFLATNAAGLVVINGRYTATDIGYGPYVGLPDRLPTVLVNGVDADCPLPAVAVDITSGSKQAVRHLVALGHTRIGCLVGPNRYLSTRQLLAGYHQGMNDAGLRVEPDFVCETMFTIEGGRAGAVQLIEPGVTAVIAGGDLMAIGAIAGLRSWGYSVPSDVSVIGFDGTSLVRFTDPALTSIRQPVDRMAQTVARMLTEEGGVVGPAVHLFEPDLVIGASTAPYGHAAR